jgi:PAS domain S-box-containing protein
MGRDEGTARELRALLAAAERRIEALERVERDLQESERRFRETTELLPGAICELDLMGRVVYINKQALDTFGYTHEEYLEGVNALNLIHPDDLVRALTRVRTVGPADYGKPAPYKMLRRDGTPFDVVLTGAPILKEGEICGMRCCIMDISDMRRAEAQARASEERFRSVFQESPVGIALGDAQGTTVEWNRSFARMFDVEGATVAGPPNLFALAGREREELEPGRTLEHQGWLEAAGARRFLQWHITGLRPAGGQGCALLAQVQDVTERRVSEEEALRAVQEEAEEARGQVESLRRRLGADVRFHTMVSRSPQMKTVFDLLPEVAETTATVLIEGESGTGKELVARSLHELSPRKEAPFVAINCGALPDTLLESELFGYKAGAFTGAKRDKPGKFALAEGGTLFLDEIGDVSPAMQVKLLRVLQERVYEPLGATRPERTDVRVVAATNRDLKAAIELGAFRLDLYYRINVLSVRLPPLRERCCDIPLLCDHFVHQFNARYGKQVESVSQETLQLLLAYDFPGNIRELENVLEHAVIFCKGPAIESSHLPLSFPRAPADREAHVLAKVESFEDLERLYIQSVLAETGGNKLAASRRLGVHKTTFFRKLKRLGLAGDGHGNTRH